MPQRKPAKPVPACLPQQAGPLDNVTHGLVAADNLVRTIRHQKIVMAANTQLEVDGFLELVAHDAIEIDGDIKMPSPLGAPRRTSPEIRMICSDGPIIIRGTVGFGVADYGDEDDVRAFQAVAVSSPGEHGGNILLSAPVIVIAGTIAGHNGGPGGSATAKGVPVLIVGGSARADAAQSGAGGDVVLCAVEKIDILGTVIAGGGGTGGPAEANAANGMRADAIGGPANDGGNVYITGTGPNPCTVTLGDVRGGVGGWGGRGEANGGKGTIGNGGLAEAQGGVGGDGGTVIFSNVFVAGNGATPGAGGDGGDAEANGGTGADGVFRAGRRGGDAKSFGGNGGKDGRAVLIPVGPGAFVPGGAPVPGPRATGKGGDGDSTAGDGGDGGAFAPRGGLSGQATGNGGAGTTGAGRTVGPTLPVPPLPATPNVGGTGARAFAPGTP